LEYFSHDGNGNLTNWVSGSQNWTYEWDWADRLVRVSTNGVVLLQNWYDANSRRIAKAELVNGVTKREGSAIRALVHQKKHCRPVWFFQSVSLQLFSRGAGLTRACVFVL
jgi:YD repeat-containing protein